MLNYPIAESLSRNGCFSRSARPDDDADAPVLFQRWQLNRK